MMGSRILTYLGFFVLLVAIPCPATTWTVDDDGPADFSSIQDAINFSWHGDIIEVQPGIYTDSIYFNNLAITLTSTNPNDPNVVEDTIIEATSQNAVRFDFMEGPDSVITGFTITGGGITCLGTSPTISHNIIRDCSNTRGIEGSFDAAPIIEYNEIRNNQGGVSQCHGPIRHNLITENDGVSNGGGLYDCDGEISGNTITNNTCSDYGGGLYSCDGGLSENIITNNSCSVYGGGLYDCDGDIINNEITYNEAIGSDNTAGGGLWGCGGTISGNTITDNWAESTSAEAYGGGIYNCDGTISGNSITGNRAKSTKSNAYGGGLYNCDGDVIDNEITNNEAKGFYYIDGGGLGGCGGTISGNTISGNRAESMNVTSGGGGLYNCDGEISGNEITNNEAKAEYSASGGGLSKCDGTILGNTITGNRAESTSDGAYGGGLYECDGEISDNDITYNDSKGHGYRAYGGGLYGCGGTISGNTIIGNWAESKHAIYGAYGGGLDNCDGTISGNVISDNRAESTGNSSYGGGLNGCGGTISGNVISGNRVQAGPSTYGGGLANCNTIINNTIVGNIAKYGGGLYNCSTAKNNIITYNESYLVGGIYGSCNNSYNCFWQNEGGNFGGGSFGKVGDIRQNPLFAVDGYWDPNDTPADESDDIWVEGDYHLQSAGGRYTDMGWVIDDANSPCIDAGDPTDDKVDEPEPHGDRINMGVYGGTAYASKTPDGPGQEITFPNEVRNLALSGGSEQLTVHWDDPNYDGGLPIEQFKIYRGPSELALTFLVQVAGNVHEYIDSEVVNGQTYFYSVSAVNGFGEGDLCPSVQAQAQWHALDINGDGVIDMTDFALFCQDWLWQAWWYEP